MHLYVNIIFISTAKLRSDFEVVLNKHTAGQGAVFCIC